MHGRRTIREETGLRKKRNIFLLCLAFSGMMTISMVQRLIVGVMGKKCPNAVWEWWYFCISKVCGDDITMMNYGFDREAMGLDLPQTAAGEQYCYQLYHYTATGGMTLSLEGLEVLEVGCGRGGGSFYIATRLGAKEVVRCFVPDGRSGEKGDTFNRFLNPNRQRRER